jgi:hypothetical protein
VLLYILFDMYVDYFSFYFLFVLLIKLFCNRFLCSYELSRPVVQMFVDIWLRSFMIWYFTVSYSLEYNVLALHFVSKR